MLLKMILLRDQDPTVECVVISETAQCWFLRTVDSNLDLHERCGPRAFHQNWRRLLKTSVVAEPIQKTFDTKTLHIIPQQIVEAIILRDKSENGLLFEKIRGALQDLCAIAGDNTCNSPVSSLVEYGLPAEQVYGGFGSLAARIIQGAINFCGYELRLNGAGLKLHTNIWVENECLKTTMRIGGDQAKQYPDFVQLASARLNELGL